MTIGIHNLQKETKVYKTYTMIKKERTKRTFRQDNKLKAQPSLLALYEQVTAKHSANARAA